MTGLESILSLPLLAADVEYRTFFGLDPRLTLWTVAELHLMFAAFVLGVPIFASIVEKTLLHLLSFHGTPIPVRYSRGLKQTTTICGCRHQRQKSQDLIVRK